MTAKQAGARARRWKPLWGWVAFGLIGLSCFGVGVGLSYRLIAGGFEPFLPPELRDQARESAEVQECQAQLRGIYKGLIMYKTQYGEPPRGDGVAFFAAVIARMSLENNRANAEMLSCPAVEVGSLAIGSMRREEWWVNLTAVDGSFSAYAGRNQRDFPLDEFPGGGQEPLIACDNDGGMNHRDVTNVLYADGSVRSVSLAQLKAEGVVPPDAPVLRVGPDSPVEDLRKLTLD